MKGYANRGNDISLPLEIYRELGSIEIFSLLHSSYNVHILFQNIKRGL